MLHTSVPLIGALDGVARRVHCHNFASGLRTENSMMTTVNNPITFGNAISICMSKFFDFNGRASRPEYWWFYLFTLLLSWGAILVDRTQVLSMFINVVFLPPAFAAGARRLHDTNRSGWWQLIFLTIIGIIPLIIWLASKGSDQENQYGSPA